MKTHDDFWECDCDHSWIHKKGRHPFCYSCNRGHDQCPDADVALVFYDGWEGNYCSCMKG
jgi:hypothetical protein